MKKITGQTVWDQGRDIALGTDGPLGGQARLPAVLLGPPVTGNRPVGLLRWRESNAIPRVTGLQLEAFKGPASDSNIRRRAFATVRWGMEGALFSADMDCLRGVSIALFANYVEVDVTNESEGVVTDLNNDAGITMKGLINPEGPLVSIAQPRRSFARDAAAANAGFQLAIPAWSSELNVLRSDNSTAYTITFQQDNGVTIAVVNITANTDLTRQKIPIPNDAAFVFINAGAAVIGATEVIFYLAL